MLSECVAAQLSTAEIEYTKTRFRALLVIGAARWWLRLTRKE